MKDASDSYGVTFYKRLSIAVQNLTNAVNVESEHDAGKYVEKVLGEEFKIPEKETNSSYVKSKRSIALDKNKIVLEILNSYEEITIIEQQDEIIFLK